jgi:hypothetical protein
MAPGENENPYGASPSSSVVGVSTRMPSLSSVVERTTVRVRSNLASSTRPLRPTRGLPAHAPVLEVVRGPARSSTTTRGREAERSDAIRDHLSR